MNNRVKQEKLFNNSEMHVFEAVMVILSMMKPNPLVMGLMSLRDNAFSF